ncbi:hypothetical protein CGCF413_v015631 [Colletotrichum fructicola]|nr:hypothetical protein CGCF413_v015631 [Colletotrichum fructicola]
MTTNATNSFSSETDQPEDENNVDEADNPIIPPSGDSQAISIEREEQPLPIRIRTDPPAIATEKIGLPRLPPTPTPDPNIEWKMHRPACRNWLFGVRTILLVPSCHDGTAF